MTLRIAILPHAEEIIKSTAAWYKENLGRKAKDKFVLGITSAINMLSLFPGMGRVLEEQPIDGIIFYSYTEHRNHRIIYYVDNDTLYISDIWSTKMKH